MAIQKPRTRLLNIRMSEEEFTAVEQATHQSGARSVSGFCRNAILDFGFESRQQNLKDVHRRLGELEKKAAQLHDYLSIILSLRATHA